MEGGIGETREVNTTVVTTVVTTVLVVQQRRHRLPGPHRDQDGVFVFSELGNKVTAAIRPAVRFVGLEGLPRLLLYSKPSTTNVNRGKITINPSPTPPCLLPLKFHIIKGRPRRRTLWRLRQCRRRRVGVRWGIFGVLFRTERLLVQQCRHALVSSGGRKL